MNDSPPPAGVADDQTTGGRQGEFVRLLHLTDLHYGRGFNHALWDNIVALVGRLQVDAIFVTGDLVNSPFFWRFRTARKMIADLRTAASQQGGRSPPLYVIAGNHDTRILGLLPIIWIKYLVVGLCAVAAIICYLFQWQFALKYVAIAGVVLLGCRYLFLRKFTAFFSDFIPSLPQTLANLNLILYPFDSATNAVSGAGGAIETRQFVKASGNTEPTNEVPYRLAIVHHHSVPIPYDSSQESLMVLKNAGAFLSEVGRQGVRLVLSGHKHHQHFSRIAINAETEGEAELVVLNTGTLTAGRRPNRFGYNFSIVDLYPVSGARITQYRAEGGAFQQKPPFWAESVEHVSRALFRENVLRRKYKCDLFKIIIDVGPDGDAVRTHRVTGFSYLDAVPIKKLPVQVRAWAGIGQIERLRVHPDPDADGAPAPVNQRVDYILRKRRNQVGEIGLTRQITRGHDPFNYSVKYHAVNSYAMSAQQFRYMYHDAQAEPFEFAELTLQQMPTSEATLQVNLPRDLAIVGTPWLSVMRGDQEEPRLQEFYRTNFTFDSVTNSASARLPYPPLGVRFRIVWRLTNAAPPAGRVAQSLEGQAAEAARTLVNLARTNPKENSLSLQLFRGIDELVREKFGLDAPARDQLYLNLMVFDPQTKKLCVAAANYPANDQRWNIKLDYGDGIAGRAMKANAVSLFIKAKAIQNETPFYYVPLSGAAPSEDGHEIEESAILSIPMTHPDQGPVFAILNISSRESYSRLVDIDKDDVTTEFRRGVSKACFQAIMALP